MPVAYLASRHAAVVAVPVVDAVALIVAVAVAMGIAILL